VYDRTKAIENEGGYRDDEERLDALPIGQSRQGFHALPHYFA